ncbi:hypothetical protein BU24DRAFT_428229 [Aaosphaeria arxii CBS 175.79]|uniref:Zn(2)-C6 fungal-type domain-containing protein n=1 Tax=Aaosphaeria arxii CBS 175.79 TaxID=1450172 RepID=A0A6A5XBC5_9PLEO|nr:uncharacterized protein BU24DRAFT_428229 [Aaosphaeria arxii CBS 175.79]KAF2010220.1 hypothetical protein BU24DRAFT_428229 [Aaosphaeria arxii CBS 175.79]
MALQAPRTLAGASPNLVISKTRSKRQKTFTGCWTCRSRHVKCDEQRPECRRCINGKFDCAGYGVRLTWVESSEKASTSRRRRQPHKRVDQTRRNDNLTDDVLSTVHNGTGSPAENLPGQQFRVVNGESDDILSSSSYDTTSFQDAISGLSNRPQSITYKDASVLLSNSSQPPSTQNNFTEDYASQDWPDGPLDSLYPHHFGPFDKHDLLYESSLSFNMSWPSLNLNTTSTSAQQRGLIHYWVTHLCDKLMPVRNSTNPFLSVVSPMALEGSRMKGDKPSSAVALFHAVCAASATHQANIRTDSTEMSNLALEHTRISFHHLSRSIHLDDMDNRMASLGTLCIWLLTHFISGTPGAWRDLVKVARNLLANTPSETWKSSISAELTYQCYAGFIPLIQSQYLGYIEYPSPIGAVKMDQDIMKNQAISNRSLEMISSYNTRLLQGVSIDAEELDRLEIEFTLSVPPLDENADLKTTNGAIIHHHSYLFHFACLIYFKCTSGRRGPEDEIQDLVAKCMDHIEHLNSIQKGANSRTWVYAVVAFEAQRPELRARAREAFEYRKSLAFATFDMLLRAAEEIWRIRDEAPPGEGLEPWPKILAGLPQFDVLWY